MTTNNQLQHILASTSSGTFYSLDRPVPTGIVDQLGRCTKENLHYEIRFRQEVWQPYRSHRYAVKCVHIVSDRAVAGHVSIPLHLAVYDLTEAVHTWVLEKLAEIEGLIVQWGLQCAGDDIDPSHKGHLIKKVCPCDTCCLDNVK